VIYPDPVAKPAGDGALSTMGNVSPYVNVRQGPGVNYKDVGDAYAGLICTLYRDTVQTVWVYVEPLAGDANWRPANPPLQGGWLSTDAVSFTPVVAPPPPEPPPPALYSAFLTADEIGQLARLYLSIAELYTLAWKRAEGEIG
jgi:hypothetical protein